MHRFHVPPHQISQNTIQIGEPDRHHLLNVLRLKVGDEVEIFDGDGNRYIARLSDTLSPLITASILHHHFHPPIPPRITLFQGLPKFDKMDWIVQKTTEIGVDEIVPMICRHSVPKLTTATQKKRQNRWQRIANEASKQCHRPRFPTVHEARGMPESLEMARNLDVLLLLWKHETHQSIKPILRSHCNARTIGLLIGPEGGFSPGEVQTATENGGLPVTLGTSILRTETAAIVSVALVVYEFRDREEVS